MTRLKSQYRKFADGGAVPADDGVMRADVPPSPDGTTDDSEAEAASLALRAQIEAVRQAEAAVTSTPQEPISPEDRIRQARTERLAGWIVAGLPEEHAKFLADNPEMIDHPHLADHAAAEAHQQGYDLNSPEFFEAVKSNFAKHVESMERPSQRIEAPPVDGGAIDRALENARSQPRPSIAVDLPRQSPSVSAPVSRESPSWSGQTGRNSRITLSAEQKEAARIAGISEVEYATNLLRLREEKKSGRYGGDP